MDVLLGRRSRTSKIKTLSKLAIARITILRRQREVRCAHARSDVVELLNLGHQERALLRAEVVIKEQNMLDVFSMIEACCHVLAQKIALSKKHKPIPDELREAIASVTYAASRCGEFPELQELRRIITKKYGKEFTARAVELPSNCGVNPKIIQNLSTKQPSFESRLMALKEIAWRNGISLQLEYKNEEKTHEANHEHERPKPVLVNENIGFKHEASHIPKEGEEEEEANEAEPNFYGYGSPMQKYRDVADAIQDTFESAAYAAAAARAAMALSRSESDGPDQHDDHGSSFPQLGVFPGIEVHKTVGCAAPADQCFLDRKENCVQHYSTNPMQPVSNIGFRHVGYGRTVKV